jgi:predicted choloylglycine hydrolase
MSDCLWGVLDGINEDGLAVSLSFGGRPVVGDGFGCPLVLRYVLEFCRTTNEAAKVLERVPSHMAYNVTIVDAHGEYATAYVAPDRRTVVRKVPVSTNHQETVGWKAHAELTESVEREELLAERLRDPHETKEKLASRFLEPPLYRTGWARAHGTLYTAVYRPARRSVEYRWPGRALKQSFERFEEAEFPLTFPT